MKNWKTMENQEKSQNTRNTTIDQGRSSFVHKQKSKTLKNQENQENNDKH